MKLQNKAGLLLTEVHYIFFYNFVFGHSQLIMINRV